MYEVLRQMLLKCFANPTFNAKHLKVAKLNANRPKCSDISSALQ